ncbi:hypothetical protein JHK85_056333 [Glycine max]|nr:hypothetical protein JHK85_056333 [Glycine max]
MDALEHGILELEVEYVKVLEESLGYLWRKREEVDHNGCFVKASASWFQGTSLPQEAEAKALIVIKWLAQASCLLRAEVRSLAQTSWLLAEENLGMFEKLSDVGCDLHDRRSSGYIASWNEEKCHEECKKAHSLDKMLDSIKEHGRVLIAKNEYFVVPFTKRLLDNRKDVGTWSYFEAVVVAPKLGYPKENFKLWWKQNDECFEDGLKLIIEDQQALELAEYAINHNVAGISS